MKLRKSCERCFKGKKKCDNLQPICKRCMKLNVDCVYPFTYNQSLWQLSYKKELKEYEGKELIGIETRLNELEEKFKKVIKKPMKLEQILNGLKKDPESYYEHLQKLLDYQVNLKRDTKFLEHNVFYRHLVTLYYNFQYGITSMISRKLIEEHFEKQASESILLNAIYATTLPLANFISNRPPPRLDLNPFYKRVKIALHEFDLSPTLANVHTHLLNCILEMGMGNFEWAMMSISNAIRLAQTLTYHSLKEKREYRRSQNPIEIEEPSDGETAWSLCIVVDRLLCCNMRMNPNIDFNTYLPCPSLKGYRLLDPDMFLNNYSSHSGITHGKVESYLILTEILYELTQLEKNLNPNLESSKILKNLIEGQALIDKLEKFGQSYWIIKDTYRRPNLTNIDDYFITRIDITLLFHCITLQVSRHLSIIYDQLAKSIKLNLSIKEIHYGSSPIFQSKVMNYNNNNNNNNNNQLPKFNYEDVLKFDLNSKQCFKGSIASAEWILHFVKTVELTCNPSYKPTSKRKDKHQLNINHNLYKGVYYISLCFAMGLNHARTVFLTTNSSEYKEKIEYCQSRLTTLAKIWPMVEYFMKNETQCVQDTSSFENSMSTSTSSKSPISSDCS